jgi:hypothetical protein
VRWARGLRRLVGLRCPCDRVHRFRRAVECPRGSEIRDRQTTEAGCRQDRQHGPNRGGGGDALDQPIYRQTYEQPGARVSLVRDEIVDQRQNLRTVTLADPARVEQKDRAGEAAPHASPSAIRSSPRLAIRADSARRSASAARPLAVNL